MAVSQNGWTANNRQVIVSINVPGGKLAVRGGDVAVIFQHLVNRFHNEVERLVWPGNWGYAERPIRGGTVLSNHASGTAIDLNAPRHPLATQPAANFSAAQIKKIREIVAFYEGVIRWGGDYVGRKDGMHFEINKGAADVARIANKVRGVKPAPVGVKPTPAPPKPAPARPVLKRGSKGEPVRVLQAHLKKNYSLYAKSLVADGDFGPATEKVVKEFQRRSGLVADGIVGPATYRKLGL